MAFPWPTWATWLAGASPNAALGMPRALLAPAHAADSLRVMLSPHGASGLPHLMSVFCSASVQARVMCALFGVLVVLTQCVLFWACWLCSHRERSLGHAGCAHLMSVLFGVPSACLPLRWLPVLSFCVLTPLSYLKPTTCFLPDC